jgi:hypothetical protein
VFNSPPLGLLFRKKSSAKLSYVANGKAPRIPKRANTETKRKFSWTGLWLSFSYNWTSFVRWVRDDYRGLKIVMMIFAALTITNLLATCVSCSVPPPQAKIEEAYFEGQRDAITGDVRIKLIDGTWMWSKSPWDGRKQPIFYPAIAKK